MHRQWERVYGVLSADQQRSPMPWSSESFVSLEDAEGTTVLSLPFVRAWPLFSETLLHRLPLATVLEGSHVYGRVI